MKIKIFNYRNYNSYEMLEDAVNKFISDIAIRVIDIKPIRLSNNPATDSIMVTFKAA